MRRALLLSVSLLFLLAGCKSDQDLAREAMAKAMDSSDRAKTSALLEEAISLDPSAHSAWALLATNQLEIGQHDAAKTSIERAISLADSSAYRATLGDIELARSQYSNAIAAFDQALSAGSLAEALNPRLAKALVARGRATLEEANNLEGTEIAPREAAKRLKAITDLERALSLDPSTRQVHFVLGEAHRAVAAIDSESDHQAKASEWYLSAIAADIEPFASRMGIADMLLRPEHPEQHDSESESLSEFQLGKLSAILTEAEPLASTEEERARHAAAQSELERQQAARVAREAEAASALTTRRQREARPASARAQGLLLGVLGEGGTLADVLASGSVMGNIDDVLAQANGVGVARHGGGPGSTTGAGGGGQYGGQLGALRGSGAAMPAGPRGRIRLTSPTVRGDRDENLVHRELRRRSRVFQRCYETALRRDASLSGRVSIGFTVLAAGRVSNVQINEQLSDQSVGRCVANAIRRLRFETEPSESQVSVAMMFSPAAP